MCPCRWESRRTISHVGYSQRRKGELQYGRHCCGLEGVDDCDGSGILKVRAGERANCFVMDGKMLVGSKSSEGQTEEGIIK